MDRDSALNAIRESLARGSKTPCTWREDRDQYIAETSERLLGNVIDPIKVRPEVEGFNYGILDRPRSVDVYAIAKAETNLLLFAPSLGEFSLAFGKSFSQLELLGFASDDALAEWLG